MPMTSKSGNLHYTYLFLEFLRVMPHCGPANVEAESSSSTKKLAALVTELIQMYSTHVNRDNIKIQKFPTTKLLNEFVS